MSSIEMAIRTFMNSPLPEPEDYLRVITFRNQTPFEMKNVAIACDGLDDKFLGMVVIVDGIVSPHSQQTDTDIASKKWRIKRYGLTFMYRRPGNGTWYPHSYNPVTIDEKNRPPVEMVLTITPNKQVIPLESCVDTLLQPVYL